MPTRGHKHHPPTPHSRLTSTRAPRPHGTPQEQPAARSGARVLARAGVEGRHDAPAEARGEARQQPRRRRSEDADPGPHSKHRPPKKVLAAADVLKDRRAVPERRIERARLARPISFEIGPRC